MVFLIFFFFFSVEYKKQQSSLQEDKKEKLVKYCLKWLAIFRQEHDMSEKTGRILYDYYYCVVYCMNIFYFSLSLSCFKWPVYKKRWCEI